MSIPIRPFYDLIDLDNYFYSLLKDLYNTEGGDFPNHYVFLVNSLSSPKYHSIAVQILYNLFGDPHGTTEEKNRFRDNYSKLNRFTMLNYFEVKPFIEWYRKPTETSVEYIEAIQRFLITGFLYIEVPSNDIITYKNNSLDIYRRYKNVLFIDGDNLYVHITPLLRLTSTDYYKLVFFKKDNISNVFAALYMLNLWGTDIIEALSSRKSAADVDLASMCTYVRTDHINQKGSKNFYVVTGDEYADELVKSSNKDLYMSGYYMEAVEPSLEPFTRLNAQSVLYSWNKYSWSFDVSTIGWIYGEILPADYYLREQAKWTSSRGFSRRNYDPMCTPWLIELLKKAKKIEVLERDYQDIARVIFTVDSFDNLNSSIGSSSYSDDRKIELLEQYLVLIGSKFFTRAELREKFLQAHYQYLRNEIYPKFSSGVYKLNQTETVKLINLPIQNPDLLYCFYNFTYPSDLFTNAIDIPIALGIVDIDIDESGIIGTVIISKT